MKDVVTFQTPKDWILGIKDHWRSDAVAGFLVFLIALPLSLGISKASGFPPIAGIYTAIIGGLVVTFFSGSFLTIKGPAAGLIVIALGCIEELGAGDPAKGYPFALAVIVVTGLIQIGFGFLKAGSLSGFFPTSAVHGMLASIGIIIASKQIHVALGVKPIGKEPLELLAEIPESFSKMNPLAALIALISLLILFSMPLIKNNFVKLIPAPLVVLFLSIPLAYFFSFNIDHSYLFMGAEYHINPKSLLVDLPDKVFPSVLPDFSRITEFVSIKYIVMFALIGSIESILSGKAIDSLDPYKRKSDFNKDLLAVGIGNALAGFVGGLPMISEIVRSSANINNGAKTRWSNWYHGFFLLIAIIFIGGLIRLIPNSALAAMLIFTGYRLASPREFIKTFKIGPDQLIIFLVTIYMTLTTDLLIGIGAGILAKFFSHIFFGASFKSMFQNKITVTRNGVNFLIKINGAAVFSNYLGLENRINKIPKTAFVILDLKEATMIDHTVMEHLHQFEEDFYMQGGSFEIINDEALTPYSLHPMSARKILNDAIFAPTKIFLTQRQLDFEKLADSYGYSFDKNRTSSILKFSFAPFHIARRAKYGENILIGKSNFGNFFFADILVQEGAMMTKQEYKITIMFISDIRDVHIPDFSLEQEGVLDAIKEFAGHKDIDFVNHKKFSDNYYLSGSNEDEIRAFFTSELITHFENNEGFYMENNNNNLLIHSEIGLVSIQRIKETIHFMETFFKIIKKVK